MAFLPVVADNSHYELASGYICQTQPPFYSQFWTSNLYSLLFGSPALSLLLRINIRRRSILDNPRYLFLEICILKSTTILSKILWGLKVTNLLNNFVKIPKLLNFVL